MNINQLKHHALETGKKRRYFPAAQSVIKFGKSWKNFSASRLGCFTQRETALPPHSFDRSLGKPQCRDRRGGAFAPAENKNASSTADH